MTGPINAHNQSLCPLMELGYQYHVFLNNCFLELRACAGWRIRQPEAYQLFVSAALISSFVPVKPTAEKKKGEKELKVSDSEVLRISSSGKAAASSRDIWVFK